MFQLLLLTALSHATMAAVVTAPTAAITPAPLMKRVVTTAGYRSTGSSGGSTLWGTVTINLENEIIATSSNLYRICLTNSCDFFTCDGAWMVYPTTSSYCGTMSGLTCSYDVSFSDLSDLSPMTNYWCDDSTLEGWDIYAVTTEDGIRTPTTIIRSTPTTGPRTTTTPGPIQTPDPSPIPGPPEKKTPIAAIVGGVVGGLAVIGIIIIAIIFVLRKKKHSPPSQPNAPAPYQQQPLPPPANYGQPVYYQQHQQQPQMGYNPHMSMVGAPAPEKTPAATMVNANSYYVNSESGPTSPVPQYSPNNGAAMELPAGRT